MLVSGAVFIVPIVGSIAAAALIVHLIPRPQGAVGLCAWWAAVIVVPWAMYVGVGRLARRALPLAALLKMTLVFPDQAPTRMAVARRAGSTRSLERQVQEAHAQGIHDEPAQAAERILALASSLNRHDRLTRGHSERVRVLTDLIAEELNLSAHDRDRLRWSALLHDIGKVSIPEAILNKPEKLDPGEWTLMKAHPEEGSRLTAPLSEWLGPWAETIIQHHEKFDGTGYPYGLSGEDISLGGRIVAVADCYETMTAARSYKRPMSAAAAKEELTRCAGSHFDPLVVRAFLGASVARPSAFGGPLAALVEFSSNNLPGLGHLIGTAGNAIAGVAVVAGVGIATVVSGSHGTPQPASAVPASPHFPAHQRGVTPPHKTVTNLPGSNTPTGSGAESIPPATTGGVPSPNPTPVGTQGGATPTVPDPPTVKSTAPLSGAVTLRWLPPAHNGGSAITGYSITPYQGSTAMPPLQSASVGDLATVTGLTNGLGYWFTVRAENGVGESAPSGPSSPVVPSTTPGAPTVTLATPSDRQVQLTWSPPGDTGGLPVSGYTVLVTDNGTREPQRTFSSTVESQSLTGLINGDAYSFAIEATNADGTGPASAWSTPVVPSAPPGAPTGVTAAGGNGQAWLTWTPPSDDGGLPITGYAVIPYLGGTPTAPIVFSSAVDSEVVSGLVDGDAYTFTVEALNADGAGAASSASPSVIPSTVPGAPTGVTATPGNGQVSLSWTAPVDDGGSAITGYDVIPYANGVAGSAVSYPSTSINETVNGLVNGTTYTFVVEAQNADGPGLPSSASPSVIPSTVPGAPTGVTATPGNGQVSLSWTAPVDDGGSAITGYDVIPYANGVAGSAVSYPSTSINETVNGLVNGTTYTFVVEAQNADGPGLPSSASPSVIPSTVPGAPTGVTATPGNGQVSLSWTAPVDDGGSAITGYDVIPYANGVAGSAVSYPSTSINETVNGLVNGTTYTFVVEALNADGAGAASSPSPSVTPSTVPGAPTGVSATPGNGQVSISWTAPSDGGSAITGYIITPYIGSTAQPWSGYASAATSETVSGLTNGTAYTFEVQAMNDSGTGATSSPSGPVTPSTTPGAPSGVVGVPGDGQVSLSWTAPSDDGGDTITGYVVTPYAGASIQSPTTFGSAATSQVITGLTDGTSYTFTVQAVNGNGTGPASPASAAVVPEPSVSNLTISNGSGTVGQADAGDEITLTYATMLNPWDFCSSWSPGSYPGLTVYGVSVTGQPTAGHDTMGSVTVPACPSGFHFGTIDLGQAGYFASTVVFSGSSIHWNGGNTLTITLGTPSLGNPTQGTPSVATYTPDPALGLVGTISSPSETQF